MTLDRRSFFAASAGLSLLPLAAHAQDDAAEKRLREDWAWLGRYAEENAQLEASGGDVGIVFMGDSITEGWRDKRPDFFSDGRV